MDDFNAAGSPPSSSETQLAETIGRVVSAVIAMRNAVRRSFAPLPDQPPALWGNRADRLPGENPIEFLRRVWGRYLDAGVLHQDTLKHLGETKLIHAISSYCEYHGLDRAEHLPPPKSERVDRALAEADPHSFAGMFSRKRLEQRACMRRLYERRKQAP
ncbi:MAG: hypothetical protein QOD42_1883 [Sphingomonadales bacterium]|nr:hypothetical protein [Sphingomonadales bacterium]